MHDDEYIRQIRTYIEQNRARYYPDAIRKRLVGDGHDPAVVDRLLAEAFSSARPYGDPRSTPDKLTAWDMLIYVLRIGLIIASIFVFNALLVGTCIAALDGGGAPAALLAMTAVAVFVGTLVYSNWRKIPVWITAILLLAPAIAFVMLIGVCIGLYLVAA